MPHSRRELLEALHERLRVFEGVALTGIAPHLRIPVNGAQSTHSMQALAYLGRWARHIFLHVGCSIARGRRSGDAIVSLMSNLHLRLSWRVEAGTVLFGDCWTVRVTEGQIIEVDMSF